MVRRRAGVHDGLGLHHQGLVGLDELEPAHLVAVRVAVPDQLGRGSTRTWAHSTVWRPFRVGDRRISLTLSPAGPA
jgi:hypothetical protein